MSASHNLNLNSSTSLLVLGSGEIARCLVSLASQLGYAVSVSGNQLEQFQWPADVKLINHHFNDQPWSLTATTHAVIARGHEEDPESVVNLLNHHAAHVYLIASAARAQSVIDTALPRLKQQASIQRLSAPAGIDLGGNSSAEIALSILAEIQWRCHGGNKSLQPLCDLRSTRLEKSISGQRHDSCPGKRN